MSPKTSTKHFLIVVMIISTTVWAEAGASRKEVPDKVVRKLERSLTAGEPGAKLLGKPYSGYLEQHQSRTFAVSVEEKRCYRFVAVGGGGADDLSLVLRAGDREVAHDRISGKRPAMRWCSAQKGVVAVEVSMYEGEGAFVLLVLEDKKAKMAKKIGGEGNDYLSIRIRQLYGQFADGKRAHTPLIRGNLATGSVSENAVRLKVGRCYVVIASGSASVRELAVSVLDAKGEILATNTTPSAYPVIPDVCPIADGEFRLRVEMVRGSGPFGVQAFAD